MYCKYCGSEIKGNFCSNCGRKVQEESKESSGFGYGVLGFFFPLIGFILFLVSTIFISKTLHVMPTEDYLLNNILKVNMKGNPQLDRVD